MKQTTAVTFLAFLLGGAVEASAVDFVNDVRPILQQHCWSCHGPENQKSGLRLDIKSEAFKGGELYGPSIVAEKAGESPLVQFISDADADLVMPPEGEGLSAEEIATLRRWIAEGAHWPDGVDLAQVEDRTDHWSFKPLTDPAVPVTADGAWPRNDVDRFILARLEDEGLQPASEADRVTWLRRVSFDLTGLPPTPEQVRAFLEDERSDAYERVVDELLASPRHGERWGQHWLDVVRYADTHGFEVNTEQPHAWPYRDYVIRAFNEDMPYDQFVREQIAGDVWEEDAATGFLVTASVLLPGQIGKDAPSMRLARQDALDEIVVNIGQTFLGLSVGCARCHDHKFDPISQRDYYAMQAFVAGIEYGDREWRTNETESRKREAGRIRGELADVTRRLDRYVPLAGSGVTRSPVNARVNTDRFAPVVGSFGSVAIRMLERQLPANLTRGRLPAPHPGVKTGPFFERLYISSLDQLVGQVAVKLQNADFRNQRRGGGRRRHRGNAVRRERPEGDRAGQSEDCRDRTGAARGGPHPLGLRPQWIDSPLDRHPQAHAQPRTGDHGDDLPDLPAARAERPGRGGGPAAGNSHVVHRDEMVRDHRRRLDNHEHHPDAPPRVLPRTLPHKRLDQHKTCAPGALLKQ